VQPIITPVIFVTFVVLVVFSLINMFIAIIMDAFAEAKEAIDQEISNVTPHDDSFFITIFDAIQEMIIVDILFRIPGFKIILNPLYVFIGSKLVKIRFREELLQFTAPAASADTTTGLPRSGRNQIDVEKLMSVLDYNKDGKVHLDEAITRLSTFGVTNAVELVIQVDVNEDGFISKGELQHLAMLILADQQKGSMPQMLKTIIRNQHKLESQMKQ
jgi:hypothetical protein